MLYNHFMHSTTAAADSQLARALARSDAGLAPEDRTLEQAQHTAALRQDRTYVSRWLAHEEDYRAFLADLFDYTGRHGL